MGQLGSKDTAATKLPKQQPEHTSYLVALSRSENMQVSVETSGVSRWGRLLTGTADLAELQAGAGAGAAGDPPGRGCWPGSQGQAGGGGSACFLSPTQSRRWFMPAAHALKPQHPD